MNERVCHPERSAKHVVEGSRPVFLAFFAVLFLLAACTNYQEEFDNAFSGLDYADGSGDQIPGSSDAQNPESSGGNGDGISSETLLSSAGLSSSAKSSSSENNQQLSSGVPSSGKSSSSVEDNSSSSAKSSSSVESSSSQGVQSSSSSAKSSSSSQSSSSSAKSSSSSGFGSSGNFEYEVDGTKFTSSYVTYNGLVWMNQALERKDVGRCHGNDVICGSFSYFSWEDAQTACPAGWRLPTSDEFNKSVDLENASSFKSSGALNGYFLYKWWHKKGEEGMYWTSTHSGDYADVISFKKDVEKGRIVQVNKSFGSASLALSIRCVKNGGEITNNGASRNSSPSISISQDTIRGALYTTVTIGSQTWMAENLDYIAEGNKSRCYDNVRGYNSCGQYGNYYRYKGALDISNNCSVTGNPWVFATEEDVQTLITAVGGVEKLASVGMGGTNESEFTIYASGHYSYAGDNFVPAAASEYASCFWLWDSDNGVDTKAAAYCLKTSGGAVIGKKALIDMNEAHSVRFIRSKDCK